MILPALGESVTEGTVTRWLKQVGDMVSADEPLLEVSTDKVDTEMPAPARGMLLEIRVLEDETAEVGQTLGIIGTPAPAGAPAPAPTPALSTEPVVAAAPEPARGTGTRTRPGRRRSPATPEAPQRRGPRRRRTVGPLRHPAGPQARRRSPAWTCRPCAAPASAAASPSRTSSTRRTARGAAPVAALHPSPLPRRPRQPPAPAAAPAAPAAAPAAAAPGPAAAAPAGSPAGSRTEKMTRLRKVIAERMVESLHVSAQLTTVVEADVTRIAALRAKHKNSFQAREGVKLSFMPFFAKAIIEALKAFPVVNASIDQAAGTVTYHDAIHLGIAVDTERGLLVPVVRDADDLNLGGLGRKIADVAERTRTNKVSPDELSGGTFTITNTGSRGALFDTPIINQPQVAILGLGAIVRRPVVVVDETGADSIAIRSMVYLALTYDHRLVDGADAARFLTTLKARLESGDFEAELG